ncbi:MAG TPA: hypothetical protein VF841_05870 [Anaeromyxobacter sp.]
MNLLATALALFLPAAAPAATSAPARGAAASAGPADLSFAELFDAGPGALGPSEKLLALAGRRVRLVGFMAHMETSPVGAFWLVPRPVECDESGGGVGDLPPGAVRVVVRSAAGKPVPFVPGALAVTGRLEVGNAVDADGRVSALRILLDRREDLRPRGAAARTAPSPRSTSQEVNR